MSKNSRKQAQKIKKCVQNKFYHFLSGQTNTYNVCVQILPPEGGGVRNTFVYDFGLIIACFSPFI